MFKNTFTKKSNMSKTEKQLYEKEIKNLQDTLRKKEIQLEDALKYRDEYKTLCEQQKQLLKENEEINKNLKKLMKEYEGFLKEITSKE